jgi:hypothetical protein
VSVDPADGTLLIGSTVGTFRLPQGSSSAEKVESTMDADGKSGPVNDLITNFSGPGAAYGSGHSRGGTLPQNLGLMRTEDGGKTWQSLSGLGEIDYHDVEVMGDLLVALRVDQADIQVSRDGGRTFKAQAAPAVARALDIAIDPGNTENWAVGTEQGTFISTNAGKTWRQRDTTFGARVTWPAPDKLYSAGLDGKVRLSSDGGRSFEEVGGTIGTGPKDFASGSNGELYAYVAGGKVRTSKDGGKTWTDLVTLL